MKVTLSDAKANLSALVARVEAGERFEITRRGHTVAELGPIPITERIVYDIITDPKNASQTAALLAPKKPQALDNLGARGLTLADLLRAERK